MSCNIPYSMGFDVKLDIDIIVLPRSNDHVYICLFVNIEIKTLGWHVQQSGVVLKII